MPLFLFLIALKQQLLSDLAHLGFQRVKKLLHVLGHLLEPVEESDQARDRERVLLKTWSQSGGAGGWEGDSVTDG